MQHRKSVIEKINAAETKDDLAKLSIEIILDKENFSDNQKAFVKKFEELMV